MPCRDEADELRLGWRSRLESIIAVLSLWLRRSRTRCALRLLNDRALNDVRIGQRQRYRECKNGFDRNEPSGAELIWLEGRADGVSDCGLLLGRRLLWTISAAITTHFLLSAVVVVYLPEAHRRFGLARVTQAGIVFAALGIIGWASAREPWQLFPAALVSGLGWAATSGAEINAIVAPWFDTDRPKALSFAFNGASFGGLVFTPLWVFLIAELGFATAAVIVASAMGIILLPIAERFLKPQQAGSAAANTSTTPTLDRRTLLGQRQFLTISLAFALGLFAQIGLFAHLLTRLSPVFGSGGAAWAISLTTICAVIGRTMFGWILGEDNRRMAAAGAGPEKPDDLLLSGCILFGLGVGNLVSLPPLIIQREFSPGDVGRAVALTVATNQAVFAFAPAILGLLRDIEGDYSAAFGVAAGIQLLAAIIVISCRAKSNLIEIRAGGARNPRN